MLWCLILPSEYSSKDDCFSTEDYVEDLLNHAARQKAQHPGNLLLSLIPPRAEETFFALIFMKSSPVFPSPGVQIRRNFFRYLYCLLKIAIFGFLINSVHLFNEKCLRIFYLIFACRTIPGIMQKWAISKNLNLHNSMCDFHSSFEQQIRFEKFPLISFWSGYMKMTPIRHWWRL